MKRRVIGEVQEAGAVGLRAELVFAMMLLVCVLAIRRFLEDV